MIVRRSVGRNLRPEHLAHAQAAIHGEQPQAAAFCSEGHPGIPRAAGLLGSGDPLPDQLHARGLSGLPCPLQVIPAGLAALSRSQSR